jgi:hypothetical protein
MKVGKLCGMLQMLPSPIHRLALGKKLLFQKANRTFFLNNLFRFQFPVGQWIAINTDGEVFKCADKTEDSVSQQRHRRTINYKIIVHTGDIAHAGTDANVSMILYGTLGDTGIRPLKQKGRNLFERNQVDEFIIECLELGKQILSHSFF